MHKPTYHQSDLFHWFSCPKKFDLSLTHRFSTKVMSYGNLLEGYIFGFKDSHPVEEFEKGKTKKTLDGIKKIADLIRPIYKGGDPYVKLKYEGDHWNLEGEADYIGTIEYEGQQYTGIIDLKFTGDIKKLWGLHTKSEAFDLPRFFGKQYKHEFLQSMAYPFMICRNTGEMKEFYYLVVERPSSLTEIDEIYPQIKLYKAKITPESLDWFEEMVNQIHFDVFREPNFKECFSLKMGDCPFFKMKACTDAVNYFSEIEIIEIDQLSERSN